MGHPLLPSFRLHPSFPQPNQFMKVNLKKISATNHNSVSRFFARQKFKSVSIPVHWLKAISAKHSLDPKTP